MAEIKYNQITKADEGRMRVGEKAHNHMVVEEILHWVAFSYGE